MSLLVSLVVTKCIIFYNFRDEHNFYCQNHKFFVLYVFLFEEFQCILSCFDMDHKFDRQTDLLYTMLGYNAFCSNYYYVCAFIGSRDKKTPLDLVKQALNIFLQTKQSLNLRHEFALMFLDNCAQWVSTNHICVNSL